MRAKRRLFTASRYTPDMTTPSQPGNPATSTLHLLRHWAGVALSAIPLLVLSAILLDVWRDPLAWDNGRWVPYGVGLLLIEFLILHSGAFLGSLMSPEIPLGQRLKAAAGFVAMYSLMVWGMAMAVNSPSLLWIFAGVTLSRIAAIITLAPDGREAMMARAGIGTMIYLLVVAGTIFIPIPEWGITHSVVADVMPNRGSGLWQTDPHRAIAGAAVYFFLMGVAEVVVFGKRPQTSPATVR